MKRGDKVQFDELKPGDVFEYENIRLMKFYKAHQFGPYVPYGTVGFSKSSVCKCLGDDTKVTFLTHISDILPSFRPCTAQVELELVGPKEANKRDWRTHQETVYYLQFGDECIDSGDEIEDFLERWQPLVAPLIAEFDAREAEKKAKPKKENAYEVGEWVKPTAGGLPYKIAEVIVDPDGFNIYRSIKGCVGMGYSEHGLRLATDDEIKRAEAKQPKYEVGQWVVIEHGISGYETFKINSIKGQWLDKGDKTHRSFLMKFCRPATQDEIAQVEKKIHDKELCLEAAAHYKDDILPLLRDWPTEENINAVDKQTGSDVCALCKVYNDGRCRTKCPLALAGEYCSDNTWEIIENNIQDAETLFALSSGQTEVFKHWQRAERAATYLYELLMHLGGRGERPKREDFGLEKR
jgi:hypothetical protein